MSDGHGLFEVIYSTRAMRRLKPDAVEPYLRGQRANLPSLPHQDDGRRRRFMDTVEWQSLHMQSLPALIVACLEMGRTPRDNFGAEAGSAGSIWPGVQNLLLAARALGLSATPTTLGLSDRAAFREAVGLPEFHRALLPDPRRLPQGQVRPRQPPPRLRDRALGPLGVKVEEE